MYGMSGADLFALRWLDAVIAVPVWLLAAGFLVLAMSLLLLLRSPARWAAVPVALLAIAVGGGGWLQDPARGERKEALASKLANWRTQALASQPILSCVDTEVDPTVDAACERALFARPEHLAAATAYVAQSLNLLADAQQYSGARGSAFDRELERLRTLLERDRFGLVANLLVMEEGCTAHNCDTLALFSNPVNVQDNIARRTFQRYVGQHLDDAGSRPAGLAARPADGGGITPVAGVTVAAPLPPDYVLPSANSIPPISIMNDEGTGNPATARPAPSNGPPRSSPPRRTAASNAVELKPLSLSR